MVGVSGNEKVHFPGNELFEVAHGVMEAGLHRSFGHAGLPRDFSDLQVFVIAQHNDFAVFVGKPLNGLGESGRAEILIEVIGLAGLKGLLQDAFFIEHETLLFPQMPTAYV